MLSVLSLGLSRLFVRKKPLPILQEKERLEEAVPHSVIYAFGPQLVVDGIHRLVDGGLVRHEAHDEGDVFFPTPSLVETIFGT